MNPQKVKLFVNDQVLPYQPTTYLFSGDWTHDIANELKSYVLNASFPDINAVKANALRMSLLNAINRGDADIGEYSYRGGKLQTAESRIMDASASLQAPEATVIHARSSQPKTLSEALAMRQEVLQEIEGLHQELSKIDGYSRALVDEYERALEIARQRLQELRSMLSDDNWATGRETVDRVHDLERLLRPFGAASQGQSEAIHPNE